MVKKISHAVISVTGFSGSGKTTFIERLIPLLKEKNYSPATIKHSGHPHSFDAPGKDSYRQFEAGAVFSSIFNVKISSNYRY